MRSLPDSLPVEFIQSVKELLTIRNISHRIAIMHITDQTFFVYDQLSRHASQLQYFHLLSIESGDGMFRIGQTDKRHFVPAPPIIESLLVLRADCDHFGAATDKFRVILAQLRHVLTAVRSGKTAIKDEDNMACTLIAGEPYLFPFAILTFKIRRWLTGRNIDIAHANASYISCKHPISSRRF